MRKYTVWEIWLWILLFFFVPVVLKNRKQIGAYLRTMDKTCHLCGTLVYWYLPRQSDPLRTRYQQAYLATHAHSEGHGISGRNKSFLLKRQSLPGRTPSVKHELMMLYFHKNSQREFVLGEMCCSPVV